MLKAAAAFDVLMPTEAMKGPMGLAALRRLTGLELPARRIKVEPHYAWKWKGYRLPPPRSPKRPVALDAGAVGAMVARMLPLAHTRAPCDWALHRLATQRYSQLSNFQHF